jgi:hypothetical protein
MKALEILTSIDYFVYLHLLSALVCDAEVLSFQLWAVDIAACIHGSLQRVAFPPKDIIGLDRNIVRTISNEPPSGGTHTCCPYPVLNKLAFGCLRQMFVTYGSPVLNTNGWLPSSGHSARLLNSVVFHIIS